MKRFMNVKDMMTSQTIRVAITYLAIIMLMSTSFSVIFYKASMSQIDRQLPPKVYYPTNFQVSENMIIDISNDHLDDFFHKRIEEAKVELIARLLWINIFILIGGGFISYFLARKTLRPMEDAMSAQNRFVSDASHELRTPITTLKITNEVALRNKKLTLSEARELIRHNIKEITKLSSLSDNLLNLLKQEEVLILSPVSVQKATTEAINNVLNKALEKEIEIEDKTGKHNVTAEEPSLVRVITILLDNAVKYSPKKSKITIDSYKRSKFVYIKVSDHGIGIKPEEIDHIFDRFYRADNARSKTKDAGGYGLGLSIAKRTIENLKGEINVKSKPGKSTVFTIKLQNSKS